MDGKIFTYAPKDEIVSDYARDSSPYVYHHESVEDLQWSPIEPFAFASCSVDGTLQVCDTRVGNRSKSQIMIEAHKCDVNVLTWNGVATNLIATGY
jgi:ribosome assembly protein RRB1